MPRNFSAAASAYAGWLRSVLPSASITRTRPGRSVTSVLPSGSSTTSHGSASPSTTTSGEPTSPARAGGATTTGAARASRQALRRAGSKAGLGNSRAIEPP